MTSLRLLARSLPLAGGHGPMVRNHALRSLSTTPATLVDSGAKDAVKDVLKSEEAFSAATSNNLPVTRSEPGALSLWISDKMSMMFPNKRFRAAGILLLTDCTQGVKLLDFLRVLDLPDTYYSWFLVSELHVWMMGTRMRSAPDQEQGITMRNGMVETLWTDAEARYHLSQMQ